MLARLMERHSATLSVVWAFVCVYGVVFYMKAPFNDRSGSVHGRLPFGSAI